ncbi:MAG: tellurium resistance protein TerC [Gammaproteobacteria bacterium]|nr:tellurium resistance protein TerC [Gammaproteobacteria bacterium]MDH3768007.1 tellurium resistance protein TerC [Gammaproteobacteria bacterium]
MEIFTVENLITLGMLTLLQAVLGFDNLLYISLESKRAPPEHQVKVRRLGIGLAVALRIVLLFLIMQVIQLFQNPMFSMNWKNVVEGTFNFHAVIVLLGGIFIIYTATKEIWHMMSIDDLGHEERNPSSVVKIIALIVAMNLVFSFDSILSAIALTDVFMVMAIAIIIGGILMIWLSDHVATFLEKNRMYEVLGLFILLVVGIMLITEGGHLAHLKLFGNAIVPMTKTTFYFVIVVMALSDVVQSRYRKKLMVESSLQRGRAKA